MKREEIPSKVAAKVQFQSNRTCCVCHDRSKPIQIHHIHGNKQNHDISNLAVLCLECHAKTQTSGGFHRKLDAEQVILYRNDWVSLVARERNPTPVDNKTSVDIRHEKVKKELSSLRENIAQMNYLINETYVNEFHNALDKLTSIEINVSEFRIPDSKLAPDRISIPWSGVGSESGDNASYSKEKYVKKPYFLMKIDKALSQL